MTNRLWLCTFVTALQVGDIVCCERAVMTRQGQSLMMPSKPYNVGSCWRYVMATPYYSGYDTTIKFYDVPLFGEENRPLVVHTKETLYIRRQGLSYYDTD